MTDKEKLEKALVHLKKFIDGDCVVDEEILADFPELAESEDERIRKELIDILKKSYEFGGFTLNNKKDLDRYLAYLENHKEQKPIEEKAKAYDEALERAKKLLLGNEHSNTIRSYLEHIFPALGESEDEKVWQWIREHINHDGTNMFDKAVEWLEKQKEIRDPFDDEQFCRGYEAGRHDAEREQKPVEKQDYSGLTDLERAIHRGFLCAGVENVPVTIIKETAQDCLAEIQPVDLEKEIASFITQFGWGNTKHLAEKELINRTARHFYALGRQSKQTDWTEKDEKMFKDAWWHISYSVSNGASTDDDNGITRWLKDIRNRIQQSKPKVCEGLEEEHLNPFKFVAGCIDDTLKETAKEVSANEIEDEINRWMGSTDCLPEDVGITPLPKVMEIVERTARHFAQWQKEQMMMRAYTSSVAELNGMLYFSMPISMYHRHKEIIDSGIVKLIIKEV